MRMSKEATYVRRKIICDRLHLDNDEVDLTLTERYKILGEVLRISPSTVRYIHKNHCFIVNNFNDFVNHYIKLAEKLIKKENAR